MKRAWGFVLLVLLVPAAYGQRIRAMDFRNRPIAEILLVLADTAGASVMVDETVTGQATFHFSDSEFSEALRRFAEACHLHVTEREGVWYVSRIEIVRGERGVSVSAEDAELEHLVRALSRSLEVTILYDQLPRMQLSVFTQDVPVRDVLEILVKRVPEYLVVNENGAWYLRRQETVSSQTGNRLSSSSIRRTGDRYGMNIARGNFSAVLALLFKTGGREYSLLNRTEATLENLYFEDKEFEELLRLVCEQGNSDYAVTDGTYYIFEIQRRDVLKKFKETRVIELRNLSAAELPALLPGEYSAGSFLKVSQQSNSVYLTGSAEEIGTIAAYITMADEAAGGQQIRRYEVRHLKVDEFLKLLPKQLSDTGPKVVPGMNGFVAAVNDAVDEQFRLFMELVDVPPAGAPVKLRYITSEELLKYLPPSVSKEEVTVSLDPALVFFLGSEEKRERFTEELALLDQPKPQIRYQILVIQYQKSNDFQLSNSVTVNPESGAEHVTGNFSNLLNVNFDVIAELGHRFALQLNNQIGEDRARILADTTLNGISGQDIKFENTTTFRYLDVALDPETGKPLYTGTTREIHSGLNLSINGWVSGDGMITMKVEAVISKQDEAGAGTTNPPPTSERSVNTQVRTRSGDPIVIGGLIQVEKAQSIRRVPVLGYIPLLGLLFQSRTVQDVTTEMVIYIVPFLHSVRNAPEDFDKRNEDYFRRYGGGA
jgi:type II secretory pathway component GspD/PulD (secretin)